MITNRYMIYQKKLGQSGFTLIELVVIIVILGILAAVAIPRFAGITESSKITATKQEMATLKRALVGNPDIVSGGEYIDRGFIGDLGFVPSQLSDLVIKPGSVSVYNRLTRLGWNGPYIEGSDGSYLSDAWKINYIYDAAGRRIISNGGTDSIVVYF